MTENIDPECSFEHQTQVGKESLVYLIFAMVNNDNAFLISVFYRLGIGYYYQ